MTEKSLARRLLFTGAAVMGVFSVYIASQTKFDSDLLSVLPDDLPEVRGINLYRSLFLDKADYIVVLESEDQLRLSTAVEELYDEIIKELPELEGRVSWQAPWEAFPELGGELAAYARSIGDPADFAEFSKVLTDPALASSAVESALEQMSGDLDLEEVKFLSLDPLGITRIAYGGETNLNDLAGLGYSTEDGKLRLISIDAPPDPGNIPGLETWDSKIEKTISQWRSPRSVDVYKTGRAAYMVELQRGMKWELFGSVTFTATAVLLLFYAFYGRLRPLFALALCLSLTCIITFASSSLLYDRLGILSVGFAAILIGLVVDYGVVIYQELQSKDGGITETVRLLLAPIFWAAFTSGGVFLFLVRSAIPGIAQLGILVAIGVILGAVIMLLVFAPLVSATRARRHGGESGLAPPPLRITRFTALVIAVFSVFTIVILGFPEVSADPETLRPTRNNAGDLYKELTARLDKNEIGRRRIVIPGASEAEIAETLRRVDDWANTKGNLPADTRLILPTTLWPDPEIVSKNHQTAAAIAKAAPEIKKVLEEWFEEDTIRLFDEATAYFAALANAPVGEAPIPENAFSDAILGSLLSRSPGELTALGTFQSENRQRDTDPLMDNLRADIPEVLSGGWEHLAPPIRRLFASDLGSVVLPIAGGLAVILLIVFRRPVPVALSFFTLIFSIGWLLAVMRLFGVSWNLFNLAAVPLLLGLGLDYSIHINLAAARARAGDIGADRRVARALLVCSLSSAAGFSSLAWSHHPGLSSLGIICSIGIILTMITAVFIVPALAPTHREPTKPLSLPPQNKTNSN